MAGTNPNGESVFVNKLILLVLVGILGCLVVLIVRQNTFLEAHQPQFDAGRVEQGQFATRPKPEVGEPAVIPNQRPARSLAIPSSREQRADPAPPMDSAGDPNVLLESRLANVTQISAAAPETAVVYAQEAPEGSQIVGVVWLEGTSPAEIEIKMDAACVRLQTNAVTTRHFVVTSDGRLANVFVYVKSGLRPAGMFDPLTNAPLLEVRSCFFEPYVLGLMTGQKLRIKNSDPFVDNVHALAKRNPQFNVALSGNGYVLEKSFGQPEVFVRLMCDIHPWKFAYIGVVDHPYFGVTDKEGKFQFPFPLPPGTYTLAAHHPKAGERTQQIIVGRTQHVPVIFRFPLK